jgi:hypothetical protein
MSYLYGDTFPLELLVVNVYVNFEVADDISRVNPRHCRYASSTPKVDVLFLLLPLPSYEIVHRTELVRVIATLYTPLDNGKSGVAVPRVIPLPTN